MISASAHSKHRAILWAVALSVTAFSGFVLGCGCGGCRSRASKPAGDAAPETPSAAPTPSNLEGTLQDRSGTPIPDALVIAWPKGKRGEGLAQARSTEDGRFILPGLRPGRWSLLVEAGGIGTLETERQVPEDGSAVLMLDGSCRTLTGVVDAGSRRQAAALVTLASPSLRWPRSAVTDANGIFAIACLGNGRFTLRATLGTQCSPPVVATLEEPEARPSHVRLTLQAGIIINGKVVDEKGRPLADATVDVMTMPSDDLPVSGRSGGDGVFRLGPVAPGKYQILARRNGYVLLDAPEPQLGSRAVETFDLRLARTARIGGRVLDEAGRPMPGVQVFAMGLVGGKDEFAVIPGALPLAAEAAALPVGQLGRPGGARGSSTDGEGRFVIDDLAPGRSRIEILHPGKLPLRRDPIALAPGELRDVGDLSLSTGATLAGRVVDEQGQAVEGALVEARTSARLTRPFLRASSDPKGEFFLRVPLGEYQLTAQTEKLLTAVPLVIRVADDVASDACVLHLAARAPKQR